MSEPLPLATGDGSSRVREIRVDEATGVREIIDRQLDVRTIASTGTRYAESGLDVYIITEGDPLSAVTRCERKTTSMSDTLSWSVEVASEITCGAAEFHVRETLTAHEGDEQVFAGNRAYSIARDHV